MAMGEALCGLKQEHAKSGFFVTWRRHKDRQGKEGLWSLRQEGMMLWMGFWEER